MGIFFRFRIEGIFGTGTGDKNYRAGCFKLPSRVFLSTVSGTVTSICPVLLKYWRSKKSIIRYYVTNEEICIMLQYKETIHANKDIDLLALLSPGPVRLLTRR